MCLQAAAKLCSTGNSTRGLTAELNEALRGLYERFACELYHKASSGFNLQSLYNMYSLHGPDAMPTLHEFTISALEDLCVISLADVTSTSEACRTVTHGSKWEWHPLPFLYHIQQASNQEIATMRSRHTDGVIDSAGKAALRSALMSAFPRLLADGRVMGSGSEAARRFFRGLLLQSIARLIGGEGAVVYSDLKELGATEQFAVTYLEHCLQNYADVATILAFDTSGRRRPLQKQLYAIAKLEQAGLVSGRDVLEAAEGLAYLRFADGEDDAGGDEVYSHNASLLLQAVWNLLVVRLWVGLCQTFDAKEELRVVASAGLSTTFSSVAVSPHEWSRFASDAVASLDPVRKQMSYFTITDTHQVVMDSIKIVTPLVSLLFPATVKRRWDPSRLLGVCVRDHTVVRCRVRISPFVVFCAVRAVPMTPPAASASRTCCRSSVARCRRCWAPPRANCCTCGWWRAH